MLVLTRREHEKIVFPDVGITVELVSISGSRARVGVHAPSHVRILRQELAELPENACPPRAPAAGQSLSHALRNRLNTATIAAQLLRRQIDAGMAQSAQQTLELLLKEIDALNGELVRRGSPEEPLPARPASRRALLVEDNANERQLLASYLQMSGFEVVTADDGADALDYLSSHERPDVVLMDMLMPRCDGPTAVDAMRNDPALEGLKIFAVSGTAPSRLGVEMGPGGVDLWFNKPIDPEELAREMSRVLIAPHSVA